MENKEHMLFLNYSIQNMKNREVSFFPIIRHY